MILGQIFDYIRIANLRDTTTGMTPYQYAKTGVVAPSHTDVFGTGRKIGGFGRAATISEATLVFYCSGVGVAQGARDETGAAITVPETEEYRGEVHPEDRGVTGDPNDHGKITKRYIRAFLLFSTFHPMQGYAPIVNPNSDQEKEYFNVTGLDTLGIAGSPLWQQGLKRNKVNYVSGSTWAGRNFGGTEGFMHTLSFHSGLLRVKGERNAPAHAAYGDYAFASDYKVGIDFKNTEFDFSGGEIEVQINFGPGLGDDAVLQTIKLYFPPATNWPVPQRWYRLYAANLNNLSALPGDHDASGAFVEGKGDSNSEKATKPFNAGRPFGLKDDKARVESAQSLLNFRDPKDPQSNLPGRIAWSIEPDSHRPNQQTGVYSGERWRQILQPGDIVRSLVYGRSTFPPTVTRTGDLRVLALSGTVPVTDFQPHPDYNSSFRSAQGLRTGGGDPYIFPMWYWNLDAKTKASSPQPSRVLLSERTAYGNHVNHGTLRAHPYKAITLPYSQGTPDNRPPNGGVNGWSVSMAGRGISIPGWAFFADGPLWGQAG